MVSIQIHGNSEIQGEGLAALYKKRKEKKVPMTTKLKGGGGGVNALVGRPLVDDFLFFGV